MVLYRPASGFLGSAAPVYRIYGDETILKLLLETREARKAAQAEA